MKKFAGLAVLVMAILSANVMAKDSVVTNGNVVEKNARLSSLGFSSGNGAMSCGPLFEANFSKGQDVFNVTLGEKDLYAYYWKGLFDGRLYIGPCIEAYYNVPVVSAMLFLIPVKYLSALSWVGYSAGTPDMKVELDNWKLLYIYQSLTISYKRFTATGAMLYYGNWQKLLDVKYDQPVTETISIFADVGRNMTSKSAIIKLGITYTPKL